MSLKHKLLGHRPGKDSVSAHVQSIADKNAQRADEATNEEAKEEPAKEEPTKEAPAEEEPVME
jgi:hypothetical protein